MEEHWWNPQNRSLIRRYFAVFRPYRRLNRGLVYGATVGTALTTGVSLILPWVTMKAVDYIINNHQIGTLLWLLLAWVAAILIRSVGSFLSFYNLMLFRQRMVVSGQLKLMRHILRLPMRYFGKTNIGYIVCRVRDDIGALDPFWAATHINIAQSVITIIVSVILLLSINTTLTGILLVLSPLYLANSFLLLKTIRRLSWQARESGGIAEGKLHESFSGAATVKSLGLENHMVTTYLHMLKDAVRTNVRLDLLGHVKGSVGVIMRSLVPIVIFCYAGYMIYQDNLTVGELIGFSVYIGFLLDPLASLFDLNNRLQHSLAPLQRVFDILDMSPEPNVAYSSPVRKFTGDIKFNGVTFSYDGEHPVLRDLTVHIPARSTTGICGTSGAGKSTFVSLLMGTYAPDKGDIRFDDRSITDIPLSAIRRNISVVSQDTFLFNDTIAENLRCGNRHVTDEQLREAARLSEAHTFIEALEDGYQTVVGVRGVRFSGGERARLSIARALLQNPTILIMDEATAFMDSETERLMREATKRLFSDRTVIIVAHRISSIMNADTILVFDRGNIVQRGTHAELSRSVGLYNRLCLEQMRKKQDAGPDASVGESAPASPVCPSGMEEMP